MSAIKNHPDLWRAALPVPRPDGHKYHRGYVGIYGAPGLTGATRLAATSCNRVGAGLVSVVADQNADLYRICLPADLMVHSGLPDKADVALGGSGGICKPHLNALLQASHLKARVFDADALPDGMDLDQLNQRCILTPHRGEFERVFGPVGEDLATAARQAAIRSGAIIVLKAPQTIIASPRGELVWNEHSSPYLAKAGTGDVLAGLIAGLAAQNMSHFSAACAAVWIHGEAAMRFGPGLIASDIADLVPGILHDLLAGDC